MANHTEDCNPNESILIELEPEPKLRFSWSGFILVGPGLNGRLVRDHKRVVVGS